ncbi:MAG TPA: NAD(P)/FAD-dependent oxidoreductase [Solirubrobacteraceae bacterium]|jgi:thioredoxin reductase|nr:NAD(P)/FAD-dependent oxidoreductase [Solirubrobacteraceae bacterium]
MDFEVVVIGGGAAGLSAALVLGRARRRTLVLDDGAPSNAPAHAIGGLLGQDGTAPLELLAAGRAQLDALPTVEVRRATATVVRTGPDGVEVDGVRARALLLATGMHYRRPDLPGLEELWGDTVFHCPFCHGWEVRGRPLAVLADGPHAPAMGRLLRGWSDDVVLLSDPAALAAHESAALADAGVAVVGRPVRSLRARDGRLDAVVFADGGELPRAGLLVRAVPEPRSSLLDDLGLDRTKSGTVTVDGWGRTSTPRVWAAGDVAEPAPSIAVAIAAGSRAAAAITHALLVAG